MKTILLTAGAFAAALLALNAPAADPAPAKPADDVQDFVFLGEARPVLVRLHTRVDGKPVQAAWDDCMKYLFDYLDVNGDGELSKEEAERAPTVDQLLGGVAGGRGFGRGRGNEPTGPTMADLDADKDGKVTREELSAYYRKNGFVPFQFNLEAAPANPLGAAAAFLGGPRPEPPVDAVSRTIFQLLDTGKDGKLTRERLAAASEVLLKLDENEDEMLTAQELVPDTGPGLGGLAGMMAMGRPTRPDPMASSANLVPVRTPGENPADLVRRLRERYARAAEGSDEKTIHAKDIGLDEAEFRQLDANNDGILDDNELAAFIKRKPDLELTLGIGKQAAGDGVEMVTGEGRSPLAGKVQLKNGQALLDLGVTRAEVRMNGAGRTDRIGGFIRQQAVGQFKQADTNGDGFVDAKEAAENRTLRGFFKALDRNGTGKVSEKDLIAYLDHMEELQKRVFASCVTLELSDQSRGLFDLLDTNRDGRLSIRELRQAPKLLEQLDRDRKGYLTREDIPKTYRLELHRGASRSALDPGMAFFNSYLGATGPTESRPSERGPLWFRKMDRNRDGDVSRKEFLFGDELFNEIDTDGDGLISVEEAERYEALKKKAK